MAIIKKGFADQPLEIKISKREGELQADLWTEMHPKPFYEGAETVEALHFISLEELITLRDEINKVIKDIVGI